MRTAHPGRCTASVIWSVFYVASLSVGVACGQVMAPGQFPVDALAERGHALDTPDELAPLIEAAAQRPFVLLGEASHGTSEFYTWRTEISKRLITEHGYAFIAVEGDWDACWRVNEYVKHLPGAGDSAEAVLRSFDRWPLWMWANREVEALVEWMRDYNAERPLEERVGFYGIDVYGYEGSMRETLAYLERVGDAEALEAAREAYACLQYHAPMQRYVQMAAAGGADCAPGLSGVVEHLREQEPALRAEDAKAWFNAKQHALVVQNAEHHYRQMAQPGGDSWNSRVGHFKQTVDRLMEYHGENARGIVWAHNTHIGDARATSMADAGRANIGQLLREKHGDDAVFAVGFGTYRGAVLAGRAWEGAMERMTVPPAPSESLEGMLREISETPRFYLFAPGDRDGALAQRVDHRAIGVVYNPERERFGNYVPTVLPRRYEAFIFIPETAALNPLHE